ncbi:unnamed protein product [Pieris brassicae]|uniref:Uncharacterized protein n=1 Tax=Pieris brassicae TaxID=7116 RepID=A0A9P0TSV7_PIEBR|nr:unnamed protein product [Pieris brassicae]
MAGTQRASGLGWGRDRQCVMVRGSVICGGRSWARGWRVREVGWLSGHCPPFAVSIDARAAAAPCEWSPAHVLSSNHAQCCFKD